eukprot:scaffold119517_cov69-Phaeocystis_antarctica.AAC.2
MPCHVEFPVHRFTEFVHATVQRVNFIKHGLELVCPPLRDPDNAFVLAVDCLVVHGVTIVALGRRRAVECDHAIVAVHEIRLVGERRWPVALGGSGHAVVPHVGIVGVVGDTVIELVLLIQHPARRIHIVAGCRASVLVLDRPHAVQGILCVAVGTERRGRINRGRPQSVTTIKAVPCLVSVALRSAT